MDHFVTPVKHFMSAPIRAVTPDTSLKEARLQLKQSNISCLAVVEDGPDGCLLKGVVSRTDLVRATIPERTVLHTDWVLPNAPVSSIMSFNPLLVGTEDSVAKAAMLMVEHRAHRVFVQGKRGVEGVFSARDLMRIIATVRFAAPISDFMTSPVDAIRVTATIGEAVREMEKAGVSGLVVLDRGWPCGVFTQDEALISDRLHADDPVETVMHPAILVLPETTTLYRAAANAASLDVRRVLVSRGNRIVGILTSLDFCRAAS